MAPSASIAALAWACISAAEWAALTPTKPPVTERCPALLDAVAAGQIACLQVPYGASARGISLSLHALARKRGLRLEIRHCPNGDLAAAAIPPEDSQP